MTNESTNSKKLGFLRFFQVLYVLEIALLMLGFALARKETFAMTGDDAVTVVCTICDAIVFWLIWQRKAVARPAAIGLGVFSLVATVASNVLAGDGLDGIFIFAALDILQIVYFATSRRAHAVLVQPFYAEVDQKRHKRFAAFYQLSSWPFWRNLIIYFCVFSVVGHWMEAGYCLFIKWGIIPGIYDPNSQIWSDWLYPFPVYGFGTVACVLLLYPIKNALLKAFKGHVPPALIISFVLNGLVCVSIEFIMGITMNQDHQLWDYSNMFCNFMGQICLQNGTGFAVVSTLMTWVVYPGLEDFFRRFKRQNMNVFFIVVAMCFALLSCLYLVQSPIPAIDDGTAAEGVAVAQDDGSVVISDGTAPSGSPSGQ